MEKKNQWASNIGFILATAGAAIGLGNLWKFPYLMGMNGGFQFLIIYLIIIVILGVIMEEGYLADIALIYAMISFLAVVVLTKLYTGVYLEQKAKKEKEKEEN